MRERGQQGAFFSSNTLRYKSISREISWNWVWLLEVRSDCFWCDVLTVTHATSDSHERQHRLPSQHASIHTYRTRWLSAVLETIGKNSTLQKAIQTKNSLKLMRSPQRCDQRNTGSQSQIHPNLQEVTFDTLLTQHGG